MGSEVSSFIIRVLIQKFKRIQKISSYLPQSEKFVCQATSPFLVGFLRVCLPPSLFCLKKTKNFLRKRLQKIEIVCYTNMVKIFTNGESYESLYIC